MKATAWSLVGICLIVALRLSSLAQCTGDCDSSREVSIDEIVTAVRVALGESGQCDAADANADGAVTIDEIIAAVANALSGCDAPTPRPSPTPSRFVDNGDGTITDTTTGLVWEKKSDDDSIHDKDNTYAYTDVSDGNLANRDGRVFSVFLAGLNILRFAGHDDWRLPTREELLALHSGGSSRRPTPGVAFIDPSFSSNCAPGCSVAQCSCTQSDHNINAYTTITDFMGEAGAVYVFDFSVGTESSIFKSTAFFVRAVRRER